MDVDKKFLAIFLRKISKFMYVSWNSMWRRRRKKKKLMKVILNY